MNQTSEYKTKTASCGSLLLGLALVGSAVPARSQESTNAPVHELDAYSVSASRLEIPIQQVGSSVEVLDRYELESGRDLFLVDALREIPSLVMRNNGGPGGSFGITTRGLNTNRPKVLVNGIEVANPSNGTMLNLGNLLTDSVSRVEVLKGAQSSLYGADALAGVISVETLGSGMESGGRAFFGYGSYDTYQYGLGHSGQSGNLSWSVDGNVYESEGFSTQTPAYGPAWADDDTYDNTTLSGAVEYAVTEDTKVFASLMYLDTYSEFDPGDPAWVWGVPTGDHYATTEQLFGRVGSEFSIADNWDSVVAIAYSDVDTLSSSDGSPYFASGKRYKYSWENTIQTSEQWSLVAGVEHETEENGSDVGYRDASSLFIENVFRPSDQLDLTLGARHDDNSAYGSETTYRGTFSYRISDSDTRVRGSYGTSFQAPTFYQLFNAFYGNAELKPESGEGWDLGIEQRFADDKGLFTVEVFGNDVSDKIDWDGTYKNLASYESEGVEGSLRYYLTSDLRLRVAHTYAEGTEAGSLEALRVPRNVSSVGLNWHGLDSRLSLNLDALFVSSQFSSAGERASGTRLSGYEVVNLAASYSLNEQQTIWVRVGNLFDEDYEEISGYQTAGANVNAGLRLRF